MFQQDRRILLAVHQMMIQKPFSILATVVFALVALAHLHRLLFEWEVLINGARMPMWTSVVGVLIAGLLAFGVWRESRQSKTQGSFQQERVTGLP